jgi:hypothetical protein
MPSRHELAPFGSSMTHGCSRRVDQLRQRRRRRAHRLQPGRGGIHHAGVVGLNSVAVLRPVPAGEARPIGSQRQDLTSRRRRQLEPALTEGDAEHQRPLPVLLAHRDRHHRRPVLGELARGATRVAILSRRVEGELGGHEAREPRVERRAEARVPQHALGEERAHAEAAGVVLIDDGPHLVDGANLRRRGDRRLDVDARSICVSHCSAP